VQGRVANCPNCGAQVEFKAGTSLLAICSFCSSVVARTGGDVGKLEILGKVAPLAAINSPLALGVRGRFRGRDFTLIGRLQLDYGAGPWNEWYAAFDEGAWGWVAEAQGRAYLTFEKDVPGLPAYARAAVGSKIKAQMTTLTVVERRRAKFVSAEGELPQIVVPGKEYRYVDLQGPNGAFATIDYGTGEQPEGFYLGQELTYTDLFPEDQLRDVRPEEAAGSAAMNCPNCGAAVELQAPDESQRVTCSSCDALLDCTTPELELLSAAKRHGPEPRIPLGSKGRLRNVDYTIFGHLLRSVTIDGVKYFWEEYLLHGRPGYRWLVVSMDHWSLVEPVNAGEVQSAGRGAKFRDQNFRHFQTASAETAALRGEFYWKIAVGDRVKTADYVAPPLSLSCEADHEEVNWSLGNYLEASEVEGAFNLKTKLPRPRGVGSSQPNSWSAPLRSMSKLGAVMSGLLLLLALFTAVTSDDGRLLSQEMLALPAHSLPNVQPGQKMTGTLGTSEPFELKSKSALAISTELPAGLAWIYVGGQLIEQSTQVSRPFGIYAHAGMDTDLSNSRKRTVYLGEVPAGAYVLNITPEWPHSGTASRFKVEVESDPFFPSHAILALLALWLIPALGLIGYFMFEKQRWAESDYG
jgi:hypothetical protein